MGLTLNAPPKNANSEASIAWIMMENQGYRQGQGLGKSSQGNPEPLNPKPNPGRAGLGFH